MWIVPAKSLSESELAMIGNNIRPASPTRRTPIQRANTRVLKAVNRSLAAVGEGVTRLRRRHGDDDGLSPVPVGAA